ncbi:MAG: HEPN domain-containing protein [Armatimonadota bacterium]|nr:HEPN domain-containing protein [Armatimonadota bacterium]
MNEKTLYWLQIAEYDFETAKVLLDTGRYLYVGFMCHQVIEKTLKAAVASAGIFPPKSHRLRMLAELAGLYDRMSEEQRSFLSMLEPLNVEGRYPSEISQIGLQLTAERCKKVIEQTQETYEWIKSTL